MPVVLSRGGVVLVMLVLVVAACVAAKVELKASAATAAIEMLRVRIAFLPIFLGRAIFV